MDSWTDGATIQEQSFTGLVTRARAQRMAETGKEKNNGSEKKN